MNITNAATAKEWLAAWDGRPRHGILLETTEGLKRALASMQNSCMFSDVQRNDMQDAIHVLQAAYVPIDRSIKHWSEIVSTDRK